MTTKRVSKRDRAVAVAEDVLKQLRKRKTYKVMEGSYFHFGYAPYDYDRDLGELLPDILVYGCEVCALGSAVISKAVLYDGVTFNDVCWASRTTMVDLLTDIFDSKTIFLMEVAFEGSIRGLISPASRTESDRAIDFGCRFRSPKSRLKAIMENIISNEGVFRP